MKNFLNFLFSPIISIVNLFSFITGMYLSIVFFLILIMEEMITNKYNTEREGFFESIIQKINDFPSSRTEQEKEVNIDLSK